MNSSETIQHYIDCYFDGTATPEQIRGVTDYFSTSSAVPESLEPYRRFFLAMEGLGCEDVQVPESLTKSLRDIGRPVPRLRVFSLIVASVAVAAVALMVLFGRASFTGNTELVAPTSPEGLVVQETSASEAITSDTPDVPAVDEEDVRKSAEEPRLSSVSKSNGKRRNHRTPKSSEKEKAIRGTQRTVELLNRSLSKVHIACADMESSFESLNNTLNKLSDETE